MEFSPASRRERLLNASKKNSKQSDTSSSDRKRSDRSSTTKDRNALSLAYFTLFIMASVVVILLVGDGFFVELYSKLLDEPPKEQLPDSFPLTYANCHWNERLLSLKITSPADEELTANSGVSMTVTGEFFRAESSRGQQREVFVRVRLDDSEDLHFPGGNNMTIPLDDQFDLSFDLAFFGFGKKKAPFKLTAEVFVPLSASDLHLAECAAGGAHVLAAAHSVHFFFIPVVDGDAGEAGEAGASEVPPHASTPPAEPRHESMMTTAAEVEGSSTSMRPGVHGESGDASLSDQGAWVAEGASVPGLPLTTDADDSAPGFRHSKQLSLAYRGGCTGASPENTGTIKLGITLHPQVLARGHFGDAECVRGALVTGAVSPSCSPAVFVLSYMGDNYDVSGLVREETANFVNSQAFRGLRDSASQLDLMRLPLVDDIDVVLEQVASPAHPTAHLLQVYACHGDSSENRHASTEEQLHRCTQAPFVWDALLVQCDVTPHLDDSIR
mmetsp:Transcript_14707/g.24388  ORF Transcript_14707/g.24388 Transcript_14707/m.24388 type:complete len:499 (+) Transcript_14707:86-1582(+)